jgi:hypothetical protein
LSIQNPTEKLTEHANNFLDVANSVTEKIFGLPSEVEDPNNTLKDRVTFLSSRIANSVKVKANEFVIDPIHHQMNVIIGHLGKCLVLVSQFIIMSSYFSLLFPQS